MSDLTTSPAVDLDLTPEVLADAARDIAYLRSLGLTVAESALFLRDMAGFARYVSDRLEESLAGAAS